MRLGCFAIHGHDELLDELGGRRDGQLRCGLLVFELRHEAVVLDERVLGGERNFAGQECVVDFGGLVVEGQAVFRGGMADAVERPHEVEVPRGAAELAIGDEAQPSGLLFCDQVGDAFVLDRLERRGVKRAGSEGFARLFELGGAQEAADNVVLIRSVIRHDGAFHLVFHWLCKTKVGLRRDWGRRSGIRSDFPVCGFALPRAFGLWAACVVGAAVVFAPAPHCSSTSDMESISRASSMTHLSILVK